MNDPKIVSVKNNFDYLRYIFRDVGDILRDSSCRKAKVSFKKAINKTKTKHLVF